MKSLSYVLLETVESGWNLHVTCYTVEINKKINQRWDAAKLEFPNPILLVLG